MIYDRFDGPVSAEPKKLFTQSPWKECFSWLAANPRPSIGEYPVGDGIEARVMRYATKRPEACRYETHRRYIDLQVIFEGAEQISVAWADSLQKDGTYVESTDLQFYLDTPNPCLHMTLREGEFVIFFPHDAHKPAMIDPNSEGVYKVVFKIPV